MMNFTYICMLFGYFFSLTFSKMHTEKKLEQSNKYY